MQPVNDFIRKSLLGTVSIPLSRDSLCNGKNQNYFRRLENVSIPLSRDSLCNLSSSLMIRNINSWFQSLYRGTAFATLLLSHGMNIVVLPVSIPLSRDSLCNFDMADTNTNPTASVSIPLSRDSLCNFIGWDG